MGKLKIVTDKIRNFYAVAKRRYTEFNYKGVICIILVFMMISAVLFTERSGVSFSQRKNHIEFLPQKRVVTKEDVYKSISKTCLVLYDSTKEESIEPYNFFTPVLFEMKVGYEAVDISESDSYDFSDYKTVVILASELQPLGDKVFTLCDYVKSGGKVLFAGVLQKEPYFTAIERNLGIVDSSYDNALVDTIYVDDDFMIGGGKSFNLWDAYDSAMTVTLDNSDLKVHAYTDDIRKLPLVWEKKHGKGKFVVINMGYFEKHMRGFYSSAYNLLEDVAAYPVINASTFYLDDFPSQIPEGNNEYIYRDYKTSTRDFYINIWWPSMIGFAEKYGLKYTGLAIQGYDDITDGTVTKAAETGTFKTLGDMLLRMGGELGYHGYNHQPLTFDSDYKDLFDYNNWESESALVSAFDELVDLCAELFPDVPMSVYVPPSNIMSEEGQAVLLKNYPQIRTVSGIYLNEDDFDDYCAQEYETYKNGVVMQPRLISGCNVDEFMRIIALSELNLHFVNNHFTHPDDALDPDRGALYGWEKLKEMFDDYLTWLYTAAPNIRNLSGTETSAAVQRYSAVSVEKTISESSVNLKINNFYDEAYIMLRFNSLKKPAKISGGKLEKITDSIYLVKAEKSDVSIRLK